MNYFNDLFQLFFPNICVTCEGKLLNNEKILCTLCRHDLPIICYNDYKNNKISNSFSGKISIEMAASFLFYTKGGKTTKLIHELKYKGNQQIGSFIGVWFGHLLNESNKFKQIDFIIPVPLHQKKLKKRGYNQLTNFGKSLAEQLHTIYKPGILIRTSSTKTQTLKERFERFSNVDTKFYLSDINLLKNKHVLLIDDVITTGATLESCCKELQKTENIKISIATIAYTE